MLAQEAKCYNAICFEAGSGVFRGRAPTNGRALDLGWHPWLAERVATNTTCAANGTRHVSCLRKAVDGDNVEYYWWESFEARTYEDPRMLMLVSAFDFRLEKLEARRAWRARRKSHKEAPKDNVAVMLFVYGVLAAIAVVYLMGAVGLLEPLLCVRLAQALAGSALCAVALAVPPGTTWLVPAYLAFMATRIFCVVAMLTTIMCFAAWCLGLPCPTAVGQLGAFIWCCNCLEVERGGDWFRRARHGALVALAHLPLVRRTCEYLLGLQLLGETVRAEVDKAQELTTRLLTEQKHSEKTCTDSTHGGDCHCVDSRGELDELFRVALVHARTLRGESQRRRVRHFMSFRRADLTLRQLSATSDAPLGVTRMTRRSTKPFSALLTSRSHQLRGRLRVNHTKVS